jgi:hypothetical protein
MTEKTLEEKISELEDALKALEDKFQQTLDREVSKESKDETD